MRKNCKRVSPEDAFLIFVIEGKEHKLSVADIQENGWPFDDEDEPCEAVAVEVKC